MKKLIILILVTLAFANGENKNKQKIKSITESVEANANSIFTVNVSYGSDVTISESPDSKIHIKFTLEVTENDDKNYLENFEKTMKLLKVTGDKITFDSEAIFLLLADEYRPGFFEKLFSNLGSTSEGSISNVNGIIQYKKDGKTYIIPSHIMTVELKVPKIKEFKHKNKYGTTSIGVLNADYSEMRLYETRLTIDNIKGDLDVVDKYSETIIKSVEGNLDAEFYSMKAEISNVQGNLLLTNKYDQTSIRNVKGRATINGYELDLSVDGIGKDLKLNNKYESTTVKNVGEKADLELYESKLIISDVNGDLHLNSKYDPVNMENIKGEVTVFLYEADFIANKIGNGLKGDMKYGTAMITNVEGALDLSGYSINYTFKNIGHLNLNYKYGNLDLSGEFGDLDLESYEGDASIRKANSDQIDVNINKKYGKIHLSGFDYEKYRIKAKVKHGKIDILNLNDELNDDRNELKYQWSRKEYKTIYIDAYSSDITMD